MNEFIKYFDSKLASVSNHQDIFDFLTLLPPFPPFINYHIQFVYCSYDVRSFLSKSISDKLHLSLLNDKVSAYSFATEKTSHNISGSFFIQYSEVKNLYLFNSLSYSTNWNSFVSNYLKREYPSLVLFYLKQKDLTKALKIFEEIYKDVYKLLVRELSIKEKRVTQAPNDTAAKKGFNYKFDSLREWTSKSLSQVLDEALERDQWFKKIRFQLFKIVKEKPLSFPIATCCISKFGSISFNNLYQHIAPILIKELVPSLENTINLFKNRGLNQRDYTPAKPLAIEYEQNIFDNLDHLRSFREILGKYPNSTRAIYHENPYFHASVADFKDGSSFDIFISSPQRILIIPQIKTTVSALERIVSFIFDRYCEGNVIEMK